MLTVFSTVIFGAGNPNPITMGRTPLVIALRVLASLLMHLQVECDTRQGLKMMKYLINHTEDFSAPFNAYLVGVAQSMTGVLTEISCVAFLGTIQDPVQIMIRYMTLASVAKVDDIYAGALDEANRIKADSKPLPIKNHRRS